MKFFNGRSLAGGNAINNTKVALRWVQHESGQGLSRVGRFILIAMSSLLSSSNAANTFSQNVV